MKYVRLALDFYHPWANNAGFYYARGKGYFREQGIDLDIYSYDPFRGDSLGRLIAGEADFAYNYPNRLMKRNEEGADIVSVAAANSRSLEALIYDERKAIRDFQDLEDATVGVPRSPRVREILRFMMRQAGKDPRAVRFREFYPEEPDPLLIAKGEIDCVYGSFWGWEGVIANMVNPHIRWKEVSELGAPYCHTQVLAARRRTCEEQPDLVRGFLQAASQGFREAAEHPEAAAEAMVLVTPYYTRAQFAQAIRALAPTWNLDRWGAHNHAQIASYAEWLGAHGFLDKPGNHGGRFTEQYLPGELEGDRRR